MDYNPLAPEAIENPYPYYAYLREHAPVYWIEPLQAWALSRYADVDFALRNPQIFSSSGFTTQTLGDLNPTPEVPWILDMNPPDHTRLRKLANKGFLPRLIRALEPQVQEITRQLIVSLRSQTEGDLVSTLSGPLPTTVIAEMLGVEAERLDAFKRWSDDVVLGTSRPTDEAVRDRVRQSGAELCAYFEKLIERRRTDPGEDVITALVRAEEERDILSASEILGLAVLLLLAGNETTTDPSSLPHDPYSSLQSGTRAAFYGDEQRRHPQSGGEWSPGRDIFATHVWRGAATSIVDGLRR